MNLQEQKIFSALNKKIRVFCYSSIDSTNNEAKRRLYEFLGQPALFAADAQTAGRGRRGHSFYSPETGLYLTLALPIEETAESVQTVTCAAAVAVSDAIETLTGQKTGIKWVNDIFLNGRKVGGILTELVTDEENRPAAVIVGIGVNLLTKDFPDEIREIAGSVGPADKNLLCALIVNNLIAEYEQLSSRHFLQKYTERSLVLGKVITYRQNGVTHTALAVSIKEDGSLIAEENGRTIVLSSGEISVKLS